jgi:hypothetical protein
MTPSSSAGIYDVLSKIANAENSIATIGGNLSSLLTTINNTSSEIATISSQISLGVYYFPNQILAPLSNLSTAVNNFVNGTSQVINYPLNSLKTTIENCNTMLNSISDAYSLHISNELSGIKDNFLYDPNVNNILVQALEITTTATLYELLLSKQFLTSDFYNQTSHSTYDSYTDISQVVSVTYGKIKEGASIESLALQGMGSVSLWKSLAEFNNLVYPYIYIVDPNNPSDSQPEKTLGLGMNIAYPQYGNSGSTSLILGTSTSGPDTSDFAFGEDFLLDTTGDLALTSKKDIQTVSGLNNMLQAIELKFNVMLGELIAHQDYGLPNLLGYRTLSFVTSLATSSIRSTVLSDARVSSISNIQVNIQDDIIYYSCEVSLKFNSNPVILEGTIGGNSQ